MEIVHELEKVNSPRGIVEYNWDCSESFYVLGISLLWQASHCCDGNLKAPIQKNIGNIQEIIQESTPFDYPPN